MRWSTWGLAAVLVATPASAQGTDDPTENQWLWTATPRSPVAASRATME